MADGKLTYDIDFNVNTEAISSAISRAVAGALGGRSFASEKDWPEGVGYDAAIAALAGRKKRSESGLFKSVMGRLNDGLSDTVDEFAAQASAGYNYRPSTVQASVNRAVDKSLGKKRVDWAYNFDAQEATAKLRAVQHQNRAVDLVNTLQSQAELFANAAALSPDPDTQRKLLSLSANRLSSITARTIMEAGGVAPESAVAALEASSALSTLRSGIKTNAQIAALKEGEYSAMQRIADSKAAQEDAAWASREYDPARKAAEKGFNKIESASAALAGEIDRNNTLSREAMLTARARVSENAKQNALLASRAYEAEQKSIRDSWKWASGVFGAEEDALLTKSAQEDAMWAAREKSLAYSPSQKAREMEKGFRVIEASSATEDIYNPAGDAYAKQYSINGAIAAATNYVGRAAGYKKGSAERSAYLKMASSSIGGITPSFMSSIGMNSKEIANNSIKIEELTDQIKALSGNGPDGNPQFWTKLLGPATVAGAIGFGLRTAGGVMEGRTSWLADTKTPYQTKRDVQQGWAQKYGLGVAAGGAWAGAKIGAAIGTSVAPGVGTVAGTVIGGLVGAVPGAVSYIRGTHYKDEKKIGDAFQVRAIDMARYYNLYGNGVNYNYAQMASDTGYISQESMLSLNQTADMLPGAMAFGAVSEQQMLALSMAPNYYAALMEGRSTIELAEAYRRDIMNLPREYRQYITSILPGASEDLRAFVSSAQYGAAFMNGYATQKYDAIERGFIPGLESMRYSIAFNNVRKVAENMMDQIPELDYPNYIKTGYEKQFSKAWFTSSAAKEMALLTSAPSSSIAPNMVDDINAIWTGNKPLGNIQVIIDGNVIYDEQYKYNDFLTGTQSYVVGG